MWKFDSSTGWLYDPNDEPIEQGYAGGALGTRPDAVNNKAYQYTPLIGPLPVGIYTMGTPVEGTHLGPLAIPLTPDPDNTMGGRSSFYLHADLIGKVGLRAASEGCIVMSHATRLLVSQSTDRQLQVV